MQHYVEQFKALGNDARMQILKLLVQVGSEGLVVGEIQRSLNIPPSTLSHHIDKLSRVGLIRTVREKQFIRCIPNASSVEELMRFFMTECAPDDLNVTLVNR